MKGWPMYQELQQLKELGLNKSQVQRKLSIDWKTVNRYWEVTPDEFAEIRRNNKRTRKLEKYEDQIVKWLQEYPDMSSAQIHDWLKEHYPDYQGRERTLRRYVRSLRTQHNIKKPIIQRQYQAVDEPAHGLSSPNRFRVHYPGKYPGAKGKTHRIRLCPFTQPLQIY